MKIISYLRVETTKIITRYLKSGLLPLLIFLAYTGTTTGQVIEEIVVTAEKRAESLQEVPIAITAFDGEWLEKSVLFQPEDIAHYTPGLRFTRNATLGQPYIRGVGNDFFSAGSDAGVAVHVDGVYRTRASASLAEFYDLERVEVLKGPQGTLYGRNATGGAINIISKMPTDEFAFEGRALYGNYDRIRVTGAVSGPIVENTLKGRVSFVRHNQGSGYAKNIFNGPSSFPGVSLNKDLEASDNWGVRGILQFQPIEDLEFILRAEYTKDDRKPEAVKVSGNAIGLLLGGTHPSERDRVSHDFPFLVDLEAYGVSLEANWDLGNVTLTSLSSYYDVEDFVPFEVDKTDLLAFQDLFYEKSETFTQELRLTSSGDTRLEWITGLYFLSEEAQMQINLSIPVFGVPGIAFWGDGDTTAWAGFAQATYAVTDKLNFTAGIRYSDEKKEHFHQTIVGPDFLAAREGRGFVVLALPDEESWDAWTPKFGIDYFVNEDVMLYATVTRGFKSGGFNSGSPQPPFEPEFLWNYEIGAKTTLFDGRLRANVAAFYYDYTDMQVQSYDPAVITTVMTNADKAEVKGVELELIVVPVEGVQFNAGLAYLDAKITELVAIDPNEVALGPLDLSGNRLTRAPEFTASLGLQYTHALAIGGDNWGSLTWRGEFQHESETEFDIFNTPTIQDDGFSLWNAYLTWESPDSRWSFSVYGKNLSDTLYQVLAVRSDGLFGNAISFGPPRTYGVQIAYSH